MSDELAGPQAVALVTALTLTDVVERGLEVVPGVYATAGVAAYRVIGMAEYQPPRGDGLAVVLYVSWGGAPGNRSTVKAMPYADFVARFERVEVMDPRSRRCWDAEDWPDLSRYPDGCP